MVGLELFCDYFNHIYICISVKTQQSSYNNLLINKLFHAFMQSSVYIYTVEPLITKTSEEFIKCRFDNFSMSFILYYVNFSICINK